VKELVDGGAGAELLVPRTLRRPALGPAVLQARHGSPAANSPAMPRRPLVLKSEEASRRIDGEVSRCWSIRRRVSGALSDPMQWCDILVLHLNTGTAAAPDQGVTH
jgi:hypothetical protein